MKTAIIFLTSLFMVTALNAQPHKKRPLSGRPPDMVYVPAGLYRPFMQQGDKSGRVQLQAFYMDDHAVTNQEFLAFIKANPKWAKSKIPGLLADQNYLEQWSGDYQIGNPAICNSPVTNVCWYAAAAYAKWRGKSLPTLDQWEYALSFPPVGLPKNRSVTRYILDWYSNPTPEHLAAVKTGYQNDLGIYDLVGSIWEWVDDFNSVVESGDSRSQGSLEKSLFCAAGSQSAIDKSDYASFMRFAFRNSLKAKYTVRNLGFRCVKNIN
ncbi:Formylglycine-generating enzyme, required for sulfatase activity, contains SUMF1/FGE domain [Arachidicoccus rhizosphaerae]|uniref:Formylglycine-generating enzyme, required for sulfatase activity, contains SUMF1/FGE domain n=1 Tax=Arachidicoccus rhizosphaerae TaxID=551991 RepID=A0A1H3VJL8_9BACT|nr:formylglycine-generating enzyme family protein [Arachidicoccus rhizosphaerae]SDZ74434.1 Formylglycine-generating enzyme, required for sulfatase activity, contains SUMF1/FGE domain [Arachidicoccus rhizosphaerae]